MNIWIVLIVLMKQDYQVKELFTVNLNLCGISENDYRHAQRVFEQLQCRDLGEYHDTYLCSDVLLLVDAFENFQDTCQENYCLGPIFLYTSPPLAGQAALKKTGVELELLVDEKMLLMFEKGYLRWNLSSKNSSRGCK